MDRGDNSGRQAITGKGFRDSTHKRDAGGGDVRAFFFEVHDAAGWKLRSYF